MNNFVSTLTDGLFSKDKITQVIESPKTVPTFIRDLIFGEPTNLEQSNVLVDEYNMTVSTVAGAVGSADAVAIDNGSHTYNVLKLPEFRTIMNFTAEEIKNDLAIRGIDIGAWETEKIEAIKKTLLKYTENFAASSLTGVAKINTIGQDGSVIYNNVTFGSIPVTAAGIAIIDDANSTLAEAYNNLQLQLDDIYAAGGTSEPSQTVTLMDRTTFSKYVALSTELVSGSSLKMDIQPDGSAILAGFKLVPRPATFDTNTGTRSNAVAAKKQIMVDISNNKFVYLQVGNGKSGFSATPLAINSEWTNNGLKYSIVAQSKPACLLNYKHCSEATVLT